MCLTESLPPHRSELHEKPISRERHVLRQARVACEDVPLVRPHPPLPSLLLVQLLKLRLQPPHALPQLLAHRRGHGFPRTVRLCEHFVDVEFGVDHLNLVFGVHLSTRWRVGRR